MSVAAPARHDGRDVLEILATILLALAAVATAWSSYQAARWNGEQAKTASRVNATRVDAARAQGLAEAQTEVDVATFIQWVDADVSDDTELKAFYEHRFRDEFKPAFQAWLDTDPLVTTDAPPTPFAMEEYKLEATKQAEALDAEAERLAAQVRRNIQRSTNYMLGVVLFAVSLFFAGVSTKLRGRGSRVALLVVGSTMFVCTAAWIATSPISLAIHSS
ncbi:MAG: hypothetical protein ACJ739_12130 [Acidimicrobiales bacterium]